MNQWIPPASGIVALMFLCYAAGRMHEFSRRISERERAYTEGYNVATQALFSLATRATVHSIDAPPVLETRKPGKKSYRPGRHAVNTGNLSTLQETARFTAWDEHKAA